MSAFQGLFSYFWGSSKPAPETIETVPTIAFHICGVQPRKARTTGKKKGSGLAKPVVTTLNFVVRKKKEESTVGALREQIRKEMELGESCEVKLFYSGEELRNNLDLLSMYVLDQERDTLYDPHIVVAVKEGYVQSMPPARKSLFGKNTKEEEKVVEEKKTEEVKEEKKVEQNENEVQKSTEPPNSTATSTTGPELALKAYDAFEVKLIKAKDPILLEECDDCYCLPGCGHGMTGDSLYGYMWSSLKDKKEVVIRCPHRKESETDKQLAPPCGTVLPYVALKKILSHHFKKNADKAKSPQELVHKIFSLELILSENRLHENYDVQKCDKCDSVVFRELKPDKTAHVKFKAVCPLCTLDKEESGLWSKLKRRSVFDRMFCTTDSVDKASTSKTNTEEPTNKEPHTEVASEALVLTTTDTEEKKEAEKTVPIANFHYFCWSCGGSWKDNTSDFCGNAECVTRTRADIINLLATCETKTIGQVSDVPEIRGCPTCGQMVNHTEACKHMTCRCTAAFCFVCMKPKTKDGNWQCGSSGDVCPAYKRQTNEDLPAGNRSVVNLFDLTTQ